MEMIKIAFLCPYYYDRKSQIGHGIYEVAFEPVDYEFVNELLVFHNDSGMHIGTSYHKFKHNDLNYKITDDDWNYYVKRLDSK
jgi:hypothetical protein